MGERRFVELCETCRDAIREAGGEIAYMPMLRSEALDLAAAAREEGRRAGWAEAIALVEAELAAAQSEPPRTGHCHCGRPTIVSERSGRLGALGSVLAALADPAPKEETHG